MKPWILGARILRELVLTAKGPAWLCGFSLILSALLYLFLTNADLSLMDQKTMTCLTAQMILLLETLAAASVGAEAVAGERDRRTLEVLLAAPVSRRQLLGGYLTGALAPWAAMVLIGLPYLAAVSAGAGGLLSTVAYLVLTGGILALGAGTWAIGLSATAGSVRRGLLSALTGFAGLAIPAFLGPTLEGSRVGRAFEFVDPFSNALKVLDGVIIHGQGLTLQMSRLLMLVLFTAGGLWYAHRRLANLSPL